MSDSLDKLLSISTLRVVQDSRQAGEVLSATGGRSISEIDPTIKPDRDTEADIVCG